MVTMIVTFMRKYWKALLLELAVLLLVAGVLLRGCGGAPAEPGSGPTTLEPGEKLRIEVEDRIIRITTPDGTKEEFVPDTAKVTIHEDGEVDLKVKKLGLKAELGGGFGIASNRLKLVLDSRLAYAWRFSLHGGLTLDPAAPKAIDIARPIVFVAYPLLFKWTPNTSIWVGHEILGAPIAGGLRVRF